MQPMDKVRNVMKCGMVCVIVSAIAAHGQTATAAASSGASAQVTTVTADLAGWLDSKKAKVGDAVVLKTTKAVQTSQGTEIKKGAKLTGTITKAQAFQKGKTAAALVLQIDHVDMGGGKVLALNARITAITMSDRVLANSTPISGPGASALKSGGSASAGDRSSPLAASNTTGAPANMQLTTDAPPDATSRSTGVPGLILATSPSGNAAGMLIEQSGNIQLDEGTHFTLVIAQK